MGGAQADGQNLGCRGECAYGRNEALGGAVMIKSIHVKNFKTLRDVTIPLAPKITVMVGANNSGKSNALAVLKLIGETFRRNSYPEALKAMGGAWAIRSRPGTQDPAVAISSEFSPGDEVTVTLGWQEPIEEGQSSITMSAFHHGSILALAKDRKRNEADWNSFRPALARYLSGISVFDFSVAAVRAPSMVQQNVKLGTDGQNSAAALDALAGDQPNLRDAIEAEVKAALPDVKRLLTRPGPQTGTKVLGVEEKSGEVFGADALSDGLVLFIGMSIAAQLTSSEGGLIAIEEPERGVHPRRLREILDQLLRIAQRGRQVVLTTHSPTLLDEFRDYPESVLIFDRDENGTHVTRLSDKPEWIESLKEGPLGDIWYSGILGGVPKP